MGAVNFREIIFAKDATVSLRREFDTLTQQRAWEDGHQYSGSIAAKSSFYLAGTLPKRVTVDQLEQWALDYDIYLQELNDWREGYRDSTPENPVPAEHRGIVEKVAKAYADKWDSSVAIVEVGNDTYAEKKRWKERGGRQGTRDRVFIAFGLAPS